MHVKIDPVVRLVSCVVSVNLSHSSISRIENQMSHNIISELGALYTKLRNTRCLLMAGNMIEFFVLCHVSTPWWGAISLGIWCLW